MHSNLLVAALAAAAGLVTAVPDRPKIYFPRHVKRQFTNTTITTPAPISRPTSDGNGPTAPLTTTRDTDPFSGVLSLTGPPVSIPDPLADTTNSESSLTTVVLTSSILAPDLTSPDTVASTGSAPPVVVLPTSRSGSSPASPSSSSLSSSSTGILVAPFGVITSASSSADPNPLAPLTSLLSSIVSEVTSAIALPSSSSNTTKSTPITSSQVQPSETSSAPPEPTTSPPPLISLSLSLFPTSSPPPLSSLIPSSVIDPPHSTNQTSVSVPPTTVVPPPSSTIEPPNSTTISVPPSSVPPTSSSPLQTSPPPTSVVQTTPPPSSLPPSSIPTGPASLPNTTAIANSTDSDTSAVTSIQPISTLSNSQPWLPTTMITQPATPTVTNGGLAPTSSQGLPSSLPKAITPDSADAPTPEDCTPIQIGFEFGLNYEFVVDNSKAAAQIFHLLPDGLAFDGGFTTDKIQMRKLVPMDTKASLGYVTTLAILCYPSNQIDALRMNIRTPSAPLYHNPDQLVANLTLQINSAIDIIIGSGAGDDSADGTDGGPGSTSTSSSNGDLSSQPTDAPSPAQQGTAVGITFGAISVAAAYGAAMFIIARRYKRKRQSHRRASSLSGRTETTQTSSPALMGGHLLSRDFSSYGAVAGAAPGGRDSHNSGNSRESGGSSGSGNSNSVRTAYISAPVAQENSLGWH